MRRHNFKIPGAHEREREAIVYISWCTKDKKEKWKPSWKFVLAGLNICWKTRSKGHVYLTEHCHYNVTLFRIKSNHEMHFRIQIQKARWSSSPQQATIAAITSLVVFRSKILAPELRRNGADWKMWPLLQNWKACYSMNIKYHPRTKTESASIHLWVSGKQEMQGKQESRLLIKNKKVDQEEEGTLNIILERQNTKTDTKSCHQLPIRHTSL